VGIGTTNPQYKFDVTGTARFTDYADFLNTGLLTAGGGVANTFNVVGKAGKNLSFGTNAVYDRMFMDTNGNVGIATTNPTAFLEISTTTVDWPGGVRPLMRVATKTTEALFVGATGNVGVGSTAPAYKLVVDWNGDNSNYAYVNDSNAWTNGSADYAEYFFTKDIGLQPGEAVCVDVTENNAVKRCLRGADPDIIGIISTNPSVLANAPAGREEDPNYTIVGLIGQVPARVSAENGAIRPGDSLTSASSTPGYLMRANAGDSTVGVALESFSSRTDVDLTQTNAETGVINVLISRRNKSLTVEQMEEEVTKRVAEMKIEDEVNLMISDAMKTLGVETQIQELTARILEGEDKLRVLNAKLSSLEEKFTLDINGTVRVLANAAVAGNLAVANNLTASTTKAKAGEFEEIVLGMSEERKENSEESTTTEDTNETISLDSASATDSRDDITRKNRQVKITVVESASDGEVRVKISGGAEFGGTVSVKDLVINGAVIVLERAIFMKDIVLAGNLELSGAIVRNFKQATGTALAIGDAVYVAAAGAVDRAYADNPEFRPAIGMVVKIGVTGEIGVALSGTVGGFKDLVPGARYYLSELGYYYDHRQIQATSTDPIAPASLSLSQPLEFGSAIQPLALAVSESEILIMPSLQYDFVGGAAMSSDFVNSLNDQTILEMLEEQPTTNNLQQTTDGTQLTTDNLQSTTTEEAASSADEQSSPPTAVTEKIMSVVEEAPTEPVVVVEEAPVTEEALVE
jgi:hypothetical protein